MFQLIFRGRQRARTRLPLLMEEYERGALYRAGFTLGRRTLRYTYATLPPGWREHSTEESNFILYDQHGRARVFVYPNTRMEGFTTDEGCVTMRATVMKIVCRYQLHLTEEGHCQVFDFGRDCFLSDEEGHTRTWTTRHDAQAWLDEHYPGCNPDVQNYTPGVPDYDPSAYWQDPGRPTGWRKIFQVFQHTGRI